MGDKCTSTGGGGVEEIHSAAEGSHDWGGAVGSGMSGDGGGRSRDAPGDDGSWSPGVGGSPAGCPPVACCSSPGISALACSPGIPGVTCSPGTAALACSTLFDTGSVGGREGGKGGGGVGVHM